MTTAPKSERKAPRADEKKPLRIAITTGDVDGIGLEVTAKALAKVAKLAAKENVLFYLWRPHKGTAKHLNRHLDLIDRSYRRITVPSWPEALKATVDSPKQIIDIASNLPPPMWVEISAQASTFGHIEGMVTAPLSKTSIQAAGLQDMGHTGILKRVSKSKELFMGFIGDKFNVVLATGHVPLSEVTSLLTTARIEKALRAADRLRAVLDKKEAARPLALLGVSPHAGEDGMIGSCEIKCHAPALEIARENGLKVEGPLVPDAAFFRDNWSKYSVYVASYHDQGLIPFKMIHGQESGIQITMGLPFVRTSVDHGTAKDIFGKDKADARSMTLAIEWALKLCRSSANLSL